MKKCLLRQLVEVYPLATLSEITDAFCRRLALSVHPMTIRRRLEEMGIRRERAATLPPARMSQNFVMAINQPIAVNAIPAH
jgi:hypothetical protein